MHAENEGKRLILVLFWLTPHGAGAVADQPRELTTAPRTVGQIGVVDVVFVDEPLGAAVLAYEAAIHTPERALPLRRPHR